MRWRLVLLLVACLWSTSCDRRDSPSEPNQDPASSQVQVAPGDRLAWSQRAADVFELGLYRYALYLDGIRTSVSATCAPTSELSIFECSTVLPSMSPGVHTIEIATFVMNGAEVLESSRSAPLRIVFSGTRTSAVAASIAPPSVVTTAEHVRLQLTPLVDGLDRVADLAFAPDGSIFIAERRGIVHLFLRGEVLSEPALDLRGEIRAPAGGVHSLALDPAFAENGLVYVLYSAASTDGGEFMLARFRGVAHRLGERAVLLDRVAAAPGEAGGAMRIGPDRKLYVALDASDETAARSLSSYSGKVLRLNVDATTPDDHPQFTPVFSVDHPRPLAIDWQPATGHTWVLDQAAGHAARLAAIVTAGPRQGTLVTTYSVPSAAGASSAVFYRGDRMPMFKGDLFVAAHAVGEILRLRFDQKNPLRIVSTERLLTGQVDGARTIAAAPDGALYIASDTRLYRLAP